MIVAYYLILSVIGALLIISVSQLASSNAGTIDIFDRIIVGVFFILSCISGVFLAKRPNQIKRFIKQGEYGKSKKHSQSKIRKLQGHHPDCEQFKSHTIGIKDKILCSGCTGLLIGSIVSIFLMGFFIVFPNRIKSTILQFFIILGIILIALNYIETVIPLRNTLLHLISNTLLVISFFFTTIGMFRLTGSVVYGIFGIILSFLFLDTRTQLSKWRHAKICRDCNENCKVY